MADVTQDVKKDEVQAGGQSGNVQTTGETTTAGVQKLKMTFGLDFTFFGSNLNAMYTKKDNGYAILLLPSKAEAEEISIQKMIDDVKEIISSIAGKENADKADFSELNTSVTEMSGDKSEGILDKIRIRLRTAFLYINKEGEANSQFEYALSLEVLADGLIPQEVKTLNVNKLSLAIWNTNRATILNQMAIGKIEDYLSANGK